MTVYAVLRAAGTFLFGSKESKPAQRVIMRRFKVWLLRKAGADGAADEIEEEARLEREHRRAELMAKTKKQQVVIATEEAKLDEALAILEERQKSKEQKRAAVIDRQRALLDKASDAAGRAKAIQKINNDRDKNAEDAASVRDTHEAEINKHGGSVEIPPESIEAMVRFIEGRGMLALPEPGASKPVSSEPKATTPEAKTHPSKPEPPMVESKKRRGKKPSP
jgi:hypothetical protein